MSGPRPPRLWESALFVGLALLGWIWMMQPGSRSSTAPAPVPNCIRLRARVEVPREARRAARLTLECPEIPYVVARRGDALFPQGDAKLQFEERFVTRQPCHFSRLRLDVPGYQPYRRQLTLGGEDWTDLGVLPLRKLETTAP